MRTLTAALLLVLATALAACGGSTESPLVGAGTGSTATTTPAGGAGAGTGGRDGRRAGRRARATTDCAALGITAPPFNEGACVQNGTRFVVANGRSLMRLRTLDAAIRGFTVTEELRAGRQRLTPQGVFLIIRLAVTNRTGQPQRFLPGQTLLMLEQQRFEAHTVAEERFYPSALAFARRAPLPPGDVVEGAVLYDVPLDQIQRVTREGELMVANFGGRAVRELGQFRIGVA